MISVIIKPNWNPTSKGKAFLQGAITTNVNIHFCSDCSGIQIHFTKKYSISHSKNHHMHITCLKAQIRKELLDINQ